MLAVVFGALLSLGPADDAFRAGYDALLHGGVVTGSAIDLRDLEIVASRHARSIIVLSPDEDDQAARVALDGSAPLPQPQRSLIVGYNARTAPVLRELDPTSTCPGSSALVIIDASTPTRVP